MPRSPATLAGAARSSPKWSDLASSQFQDHRVSRVAGSPITLRGFLLLLVTVYLVMGPATREKDVVASVLGFTLLLSLLFFMVINLILSIHLKRSARFTVNTPIDTVNDLGVSEVESRRLITILTQTSNIRLFPFIILSVSIEFELDPAPATARHEIVGSKLIRQTLVEQIVFPHRGSWRIKSLLLNLSDQAGLVATRWRYYSNSVARILNVSPSYVHSCSLPIVSSSNRPGDDITDMHQRKGEPFDLKQYHPADGAKKILWKVYAKTGELISRHPERAMTPEGEVVVFLLADRPDDDVASLCLAYLRKINELNLDLVFGCEGMVGTEYPSNFAKSHELILASVFSPTIRQSESTQAIIRNLIHNSGVQRRDRPIEKLALFVSAARFTSRADLDFVMAIGSFVQDLGIAPVFCIATQFENSSSTKSLLSGQVRSSSLSNLINFFLLDEKPQIARPTGTLYGEFVNSCLGQDWQIYEQPLSLDQGQQSV